jgi:sugar phosphate isomerase/epimerase
VGAEVVTVHSGLPREGQRSSEFIEERAAQLRRIGDYAGENGVRIGVENEGGTCEDYLGLVATIAHPSVGATLDLGHCAYCQSVLALRDPAERVVALNETIRTMVRTLGADLFSLHVHDVRQSDWRDHRCVGSGVIDFPALFEELQRVGYSGLFEIELEEPDKEVAAATTGEYVTTLCRTMPANTLSAEAADAGNV